MDRTTSSSSNSLENKPSFLKHVLNFDDTGKSEMLNIVTINIQVMCSWTSVVYVDNLISD